MNPDVLETIDYFQKSLLFSLTDEFEWDTIPISTTDTTTLSMEYTMTFSNNLIDLLNQISSQSRICCSWDIVRSHQYPHNREHAAQEVQRLSTLLLKMIEEALNHPELTEEHKVYLEMEEHLMQQLNNKNN